MDLDLYVTLAIGWARAIEQAVHGRGRWTFRTDGGTTMAHRIIDRSGCTITFTGLAARSESGMVELWHDDLFIASAYPDFTQGDHITWKLSPGSTVHI